MDDVYIVPVFILFFLCFWVFVLFIIRKIMSSVFTEKYSLLKQIYPYPLHSYGWLSGRFKGMISVRFNGLLKIDVYENMIIVSSLGKGVCFPYNEYIFEHKQILFYNALVVKTLPKYDEDQEEPKTILEIKLSSNKINTILSLAQK